MKNPVHVLAAIVLFLTVVIVFLGATSAFSQEAGWTDDYTKAVAQAKTENKAILLDFTGSDWCGWCMKMKKETLDTPQFDAYARKSLVLVTVDFPHNKQLAPAVKQQNAMLDGKYHAQGFPTYVLIDKFGRELWRQTGYLAGGPTVFIAALSKVYTPAPVKAAGDSHTDDFDAFFKKSSPAPNS
jgi:thioredoxin-related protein